MIFDRIMLPAQGRSEDYKFAQTGSVTLVASVGGAGGGASTPSWLENVIKLDPESGYLSVDNWHIKGELIIEGQVNQWLAQQLIVDDARIQVNRKQEGAVVDSGLVIFDKDTSTEVSSLVYDVNGIWKAGGDRLFTEAYNPKLGGYAAGDYPRKAEDASITGLWSIYRAGADTTLLRFGTERPWQFRQVREGASAGLSLVSEAGSKSFDIRNTQGVRAADFFVGETSSRVLLVPDGGNVGIGLDTTPTERLHVAGNGLFTGNLSAPTFVSGFAGSGWKLEAGVENHLTVDRLTVRGRMDVYELVVNQIRGTNGALWVSDSAKVASVSGNRLTIDTGGDTSFVPFVVNDLLRCQRWNGKNIKYYVVRVTAVGSNYIDVTLVAGSSPREAGDHLVRMGNTEDADRQGALYLTSSDSNAPYMDVLDGVNSASFAGKTKVRLGRLDGITDPDLGTLSGYGLYTENGYFKGKIQVTGGNAATKADIDALQIGGRNLLLGTGTGEGWSYSTFEDGIFTRSTTGTSEVFIASIGQIDLERNTKYTLSAWIKTNGYVKDVDFFVYDKSNTHTHSKQNIPASLNWEFVSFTFTTADADYSEARIRFDNNGSTSAGTLATLYVKMPKLEKGNKATDWTPAPEDVPSALDYLATAIQDGSTDIEGGLINTNVLMVKDTNGAVRGGISGLASDNVGFWTGGTYQAAINNDANVIFRKDGSFSLAGGKISGTSDGALSVDAGIVTGLIESANYNGIVGSRFDLDNGNLMIGNAINIDSYNSEIQVKDRETGNYIVKIGDFPLTSIYDTLYNFDKAINSQNASLSSSGTYTINGNVYLDSIGRSDVLIRSSTTSTQYYLVNNLTVGNSYRFIISGIRLRLMPNAALATLPTPYPYLGFSGGSIKVQLKNGSNVIKEYIYNTTSDGIRQVDDMLLNFTATSTQLQLVITPIGDFYHHALGAGNTTIRSNCTLVVERDTSYNNVMLFSLTSAIELSTKGLQVAFSANSFFKLRFNYSELRTTQMFFSENGLYGLRIDNQGVYIKKNGGAWTPL